MDPNWKEGVIAEDKKDILTRRMDSFVCEILMKRPLSKEYYWFTNGVIVYIP